MSKIIPYCPNVSWGNVFGKVFFDHCSMDSSKVFEKFKKNSKLQKCPRSFPKMSKLVLNMFCGNFLEKKCPVFHGGSSLRKVSEKSKKVQFSKIALNRFQKCPKVFWTFFGATFAKVFCPVVSGLKNMSSVLRNNTKQTSILPSRHSQYTQSHFRFSGLKIMSSDSRI